MIEYVADAFPAQAQLSALWPSAWGVPLSQNMEPVLQRSLTHICAFDGQELVGFVNAAWDGGGHVFIVDLCVHPRVQRQGIATKLVSDVISVARERDIEWVHADYVSALSPFYEKCGFRPSSAGVMKLR